MAFIDVLKQKLNGMAGAAGSAAGSDASLTAGPNMTDTMDFGMPNDGGPEPGPHTPAPSAMDGPTSAGSSHFASMVKNRLNGGR